MEIWTEVGGGDNTERACSMVMTQIARELDTFILKEVEYLPVFRLQ
jgi:hypothetical protein